MRCAEILAGSRTTAGSDRRDCRHPARQGKRTQVCRASFPGFLVVERDGRREGIHGGNGGASSRGARKCESSETLGLFFSGKQNENRSRRKTRTDATRQPVATCAPRPHEARGAIPDAVAQRWAKPGAQHMPCSAGCCAEQSCLGRAEDLPRSAHPRVDRSGTSRPRDCVVARTARAPDCGFKGAAPYHFGCRDT